MLIKNNYFDCKFVCFSNHFDCFLADEATIITISAIKSKIAKNIKNFKERKEFKNYDKGFND